MARRLLGSRRTKGGPIFWWNCLFTPTCQAQGRHMIGRMMNFEMVVIAQLHGKID